MQKIQDLDSLIMNVKVSMDLFDAMITWYFMSYILIWIKVKL